MRYRIVFLLIFVLLIPTSAYNNNYEFTTTDSKIRNLGDVSDKPILLDTMASWCQPCKDEFEHLLEVYKIAGDEVEILSISVGGTDDLNKVKKFKADAEAEKDSLYPWIWGLDHNDEMFTGFDIKGLPSLYLLDVEGNIVSQWQGLTPTSEILNAINSSISYTDENLLSSMISNLVDNIAFQATMVVFIIAIIYFKFIPKNREVLN